MARTITLSEAVVRFAPLITTNIEVEDAIREAVARIYELGRYPGTTTQIELAEEDFVEDADLKEWYISFDETEYNGAIGFRNQNRGWSIVDTAVLYKDGVNAGDFEFVDLGTITTDGIETRKYRCPLGWEPSLGPYYVLMKKEPPDLGDDDLIPVQSLGALKCAIQAVCYEYVNDEERANLCWQKFDAFIIRSERQTEGPKRYTLGMDSSLRRKPSQFH
jgi:hypothetical protein